MLSSKYHESTIDIRQIGHPEFQELPCSSKKFGLKANAYSQTSTVSTGLGLPKSETRERKTDTWVLARPSINTAVAGNLSTVAALVTTADFRKDKF